MDPFFITAALLYFVPSLVAFLRHIKTPQGPILLNIFLGWTIVGWVAALIWAACASPREAVMRTPLQPGEGAMFQIGRCVGFVRNAIRPVARP